MNLLPKTEKDILKKGFKSRFIIILLLLVSVSFFVGFIMLLPSYLLMSGHFLGATLEDNNLDKEDEASVKEILNLPTEIDSKLKVFQSNIDTISITNSFSGIIENLPLGVTLDSISFRRNLTDKEKKGVTILISGMAPNRDSLIAFSTKLKDSGSFSSVEVPVSSLTRDRDLPFSINIFIES